MVSHKNKLRHCLFTSIFLIYETKLFQAFRMEKGEHKNKDKQKRTLDSERHIAAKYLNARNILGY